MIDIRDIRSELTPCTACNTVKVHFAGLRIVQRVTSLRHPAAHHAIAFAVTSVGFAISTNEAAIAHWTATHLPEVVAWVVEHLTPGVGETVKAAGILPYVEGIATLARLKVRE